MRELRHLAPVTDADVPDADVVIATWWETAEWVWSLSNGKGVKVHFLQDYETWGVAENDTQRIDKAIGLPVPKIVIAKWVSDLLVRYFGQTPLAVIPNSVNTDQFQAAPRGKQKVVTVGFTYTTMWNKGADVSVAAINRARLSFPELRVVTFGNARPPRQNGLPRAAQFYFRAPEEALPQLYASCDAWLFGTRIEGFGLPILEAMACRTPVIGTPAGAAPDLLQNGAGILVPMEDAGAMADGIVRIARMSDQEWRVMSDAAYRQATIWPWAKAVDLFEQALMKAAGRPNYQ